MRNLTATLCLILFVLLGVTGCAKRTADFQKGFSDFQTGSAAFNRGDYATALRELKPLAEQQSAYAQFSLGWMYQKGLGVPQNHKTAVKWYRLAANQGYAYAQTNLGVMYAEGQGVPQDYKTAMKWYRLAAEQGNAFAQYNMGEMYQGGYGVPRNYKSAYEAGTLSPEQENASAQHEMYQGGYGVPRNYNSALKWYKLSAEQGNASAQHDLGRMYEIGRGVPWNYKTALKWYRLAAKQGLLYAQTRVEILQKKIADQIELRERAKQGDAKAQSNLGEMYEKGRGVPRNYKSALKWYKLAAKQGLARAQSKLGRMYEIGRGGVRDYEIALKWYRLAAKQEFSEARRRLGELENKIAEIYALEKSAKQGTLDALNRLGYMFLYGVGVPQDDKKAVKWFRLAAEQGDAQAQTQVKLLQKNIADQNELQEPTKQGNINTQKESPTQKQPTLSPATFPLDKAEKKCAQLSFTIGTEKYGDCVMKLLN